MNKSERTRNIRYLRPALAIMQRDCIMGELSAISEECESLEYAVNDDEKLINVFQGDSDEIFEFRMRFSDLAARCNELWEALNENEVNEHVDDFFVGSIGPGYNILGYDKFEEDYFHLTAYESQLASDVSKKRLMGITKSELIAVAGQCIGIMMSMLDIRHDYSCLKSTLDILKDERYEIMNCIKGVSEAYDALQNNPYDRNAIRHFDDLLDRIPDAAWVQ